MSTVCVSMVCFRMVCVSPRSRNLASHETTQYCFTIQGRCVVAHRRTRSSPRRRPGLDCINATTGRRHGNRKVVITVYVSREGSPRRAARALLALGSLGRPPTEHTCRAVRTWRDCVVGQRRTRSSPRRRPGLGRTNTATGRRHGFRKVVATILEPREARPARFSSCGASADRPRSTCAAQCGLGVVALWANAGSAPPLAVGRGSAAPTPRQVGGTDFEIL